MSFWADHGQLIPELRDVRRCMLEILGRKRRTADMCVASTGISATIRTLGAGLVWFAMSSKRTLREGTWFQQAVPFQDTQDL